MKNIKERLKKVVCELRQFVRKYLNILQTNKTLAHADIETNYKNKFDRVTLYRTLTTFIESGILHKVSDNSGVAKFALCQHHDCNQHKHEDNHVHFKCNICNKIECLHELSIPDFKLPKTIL